MHTTEQLNTALAGRYTIDRLVGEGGMATVYLARDVKHNRRVALKVLKPDLGAVVGVERFLSEIQVTANLQHPNLLPLFDSGAADGLLFYVMPYVEGESLRAKLDREKQLPIDDAVHIAVAVASALDYAHRQGVIHRDLKPENILMHEGQPLVADFGIALAVSNAGGNRITQTGLSLGTPQYMSPEQATGDRAIDGRTDIYSLGAVTYEMLVGEAPHTGTTSQAIIARVLTERPRSIRSSRPNVPAHVEGAVEHALEKLPADRWVTAKEFSEALTGARPVTASPHTAALAPSAIAAHTSAIVRRHRVRETVLAAVAFAGIAASAWMAVRQNRPVPPAVPAEFEVQMPDSVEATLVGSATTLALSRDGSLLVFQATRANAVQALYARSLNDRTVQLIRGTEAGSRSPSFSPDGTELLFNGGLTSGVIKRVAVRGGTARTVVDSGGNQFSWGDAHLIVYGFRTSLWIVSEDGGPPRLLAAPDSARGHRLYGWPEILPGGKAALMTVRRGTAALDSSVLAIVSIPDGKVTELGIHGTNPRYSATGHILYATVDNGLFAVPFSLRSLRTSGSPIPIAEDVHVGPGGAAAFAIARNGTLAYLGGASGSSSGRTLVAVSRSGVERVIEAKPGFYQGPRVSPDGRLVALTAFTQGGPASQSAPNPDVWRLDLKSNVLTRLTTDSASYRPVWSPDGERIAYVKAGGDSVVMWRPLYATGQATPLVRSSRLISEVATGKTHGYWAAKTIRGVSNSYDVYLFHSDSAASARPFLNEAYFESTPRISPDGALMAYVTNKTGAQEVYLRPLKGTGPEVQVSRDGGAEPVWAPGGRELFYRVAGYLMSARLAEGPRLDIAKRDTLFRDSYLRNGGSANYDVFPDGKEFVMLRGAGASTGMVSPLVVIVNWSPGKRAAAPVGQ